MDHAKTFERDIWKTYETKHGFWESLLL